MAVLTDEQVQAAFDWLHQNSDRIGAARATVVRRGYEVKQVRARIKKGSLETSDTKRCDEAECHPDFIRACEAHASAEGAWEALKDERMKCEMILELYRTQSANERGIRRIG
jgi:hypothetical protein